LQFLEKIPEVENIYIPEELWDKTESPKVTKKRKRLCSKSTNIYFLVELDGIQGSISLYLYANNTVDVIGHKPMGNILQKDWNYTIRKMVENKSKKNFRLAAAIFGLLLV
jgi:hypothetical protein